MNSKIRILSDLTINKIAAGEVIENPASVVKELVENSVDAGAKSIVVEIKGGGLGLIRISDDGHGMGKEDALLSLERHATSKIRDEDDLFEIVTMGFRGEALASIASISKLILTTSDGKEGTRVEVDGGGSPKVEVAARARGTTIEVASLFYNVPARKKFQKSATLCAAEVTRILTVLALATPSVSFELIQNEKRTLFVPSEVGSEGALARRAKTLLGEDFGDKALPVFRKEGAMSLTGILGLPSQSHPNRKRQYLFINGRSVYAPSLSFAVKDAYGMRLEASRFPIYVLHVTVSPNRLDVNVHPQKKEVRFKDEALLKQQVKEAVIASLNPKPPFSAFKCANVSFAPRQAESFFSTFPLRFRAEAAVEAMQESMVLTLNEPKGIGIYDNYLLLEASSVASRLSLKGEGGIVFVDLVAASARLFFERAQKKGENPPSQALLIPLTLSFSMQEMEQMKTIEGDLMQMGFDLRVSGPKSYLVEAHPAELHNEEVKEYIVEALFEIKENQYKKERGLAALCSRLAKRRGKFKHLQEAIYLFEELLKTSASNECPLGKPTITQMSHHDLINRFTP